MAKQAAVSQELIRRRWTESDAREVLAELDASGLFVTQFAAREGIDPQRLYSWRRRLTEPTAQTFVELRSTDAAPLEIVLRSGRIVRVPASFDAGALRRLLDALES
jgi:transposase-like protein